MGLRVLGEETEALRRERMKREMWDHRSPEWHLKTQVLPSSGVQVEHGPAHHYHGVVFLHLRQYDHVHSSCTQEYSDFQHTPSLEGATSPYTGVPSTRSNGGGFITGQIELSGTRPEPKCTRVQLNSFIIRNRQDPPGTGRVE